MVTVGVLLRVDESRARDVELGLNDIEGVSTLPLEENGSLGALIQADDLDSAHATLVDGIQALNGVLCAWPVHTAL